MFETDTWSRKRRHTAVAGLGLLFVAANVTVFLIARDSDSQVSASGWEPRVLGSTTLRQTTTFTTIEVVIPTLATIPLEVDDTTPPSAPDTAAPASAGTAGTSTTRRPTTTTTAAPTTSPPLPPAPTLVPVPSVSLPSATWSVTAPPATIVTTPIPSSTTPSATSAPSSNQVTGGSAVN